MLCSRMARAWEARKTLGRVHGGVVVALLGSQGLVPHGLRWGPHGAGVGGMGFSALVGTDGATTPCALDEERPLRSPSEGQRGGPALGRRAVRCRRGQSIGGRGRGTGW
jgi:hypothetical protein